MWTKFTDNFSGGDEKLGPNNIWIEASRDIAVYLFEQIFERDPFNVTCNCCGTDYILSEQVNAEIKNGDWVVTATDILRFNEGRKITGKYQRIGK